jgi:ribokinase
MTKAHIISLGSINVDFQVRVKRHPERGETLLAEDYLMASGGKGANVAFIARRLGVEARLLARLGSDLLAEEALRPLRQIGVDLDLTKRVEDQSTGTSLIVVQPDGNKTIILATNANEAWIWADTDEVATAIRQAPAGSVLVTDLEISIDVVRQALTTAREHEVRTVLDPSPAERMVSEIYPFVDYITPNPAEVEQLTGIRVQSPEDGLRAGHALLERGVGTVLVKFSGGCTVVSREFQEYFPAPQVQVVDKTGAGDAFAGALAVALLQGKAKSEVAQFAVAAAALAVTRYGSQASYPTQTEIEQLLAVESSVPFRRE